MACSIRFYSKLGRNASKKAFDIVRVKRPQVDEAVVFMANHYLDDPLVRSMGISRNNRETQNFLSKLWEILLKQELSLAAMKNKKICGLCVNCPQTYIETTPNDAKPQHNIFQKLGEATNQNEIRTILKAWDKIDREIRFPKIDKDSSKIKTLELSFCAVDRQNRRSGIARKVISSSEDLASALGYDYVRLDSTNKATARICKQLGWRKIWDTPFEKFFGVRKESIEEDNKRVQVYIKSLHAISMKK